jgi:hypothetical protein
MPKGAFTPGGLPPEARRAANQAVLAYLEARARPAATPSVCALDQYELRTHPDLIKRLQEVAVGTAGRLVAAFGVPVLVHPNGIIFALAFGASSLCLRLPPRLLREVIARPAGPGLGDDWVAADPWLSALPRREGTQVLRDWCWLACEYAATLGQRDQGAQGSG